MYAPEFTEDEIRTLVDTLLQLDGRLRGIYEVWNLKTGRRYIGKSTNLASRLLHHKRQMQGRRHENRALCDDLKVYAPEDFALYILRLVPRDEDLDKAELYEIYKAVKAEEPLYNSLQTEPGAYRNYLRKKLRKAATA